MNAQTVEGNEWNTSRPKVEMESIKKTQNEGMLEMKNLGIWAGTRGKLHQQNTEMPERVWDIKNTIEEMCTFIKENAKKKKVAGTKHPGTLWKDQI